MSWRRTMERAARGLRRERSLYLVVVSSLVAAFLCLGAALLAERNVGLLAERWGASQRMTVYLADAPAQEAVESLQERLVALPEVREARYVSPQRARREFLEQSRVQARLETELPTRFFPASIEVQLAAGTEVQRVSAIASRLRRLAVVDSVETYEGWLQQVRGLLVTVRNGALVAALLVLLCVLAVVANTVRLVMAGRCREVEVMRLCGATERFIGVPVLLEGAAQGLAAALLSVLLLYAAFGLVHESLAGGLGVLLGFRPVFLSPGQVLGIVLGGGCLGALGGALSLRRALRLEG